MRRTQLGLCAALASALLATQAQADCHLQKYAELAVSMSGLAPTVEATINGKDVRLALDTGAFFSLLSPEAVARLGLRKSPLPPNLKVSGVTGAADIGTTHVTTFGFAGYQLHDFDFLVGEHSLAGDGVLGENVIGGGDAEYDLANGVVRLFKPKGCEKAVLAYWVGPNQSYGEMSIEPILPPVYRILGSATLNGKHLTVEFDSGSSRSMLTLGAARRAGVKTSGPDVTPAGALFGIGAHIVESWLAPFDSFDIGGEQIKSTRLRLADLELQGADMLLGADFFLSHRIFISKSQGKVYFTYNGGPVFNLEQAGAPAPPTPEPAGAGPVQASSDEPKDAAGFARRAAAEVSRRAFDLAIADDTKAAALEPSEVSHFYDRAMARALNHQPVLAMDDLSQALKLKADDAPALMLRGELRLAGKDTAGAAADFQAAIGVDADLRLRVAAAYLRAEDFPDAVGQYDAWIMGRPRNEDLAKGLAGRCWARAVWGQDLPQALKDCDAALSLFPGIPEAQGGRGLVRLRMGEYDKAIADCSAALKFEPRRALCLYARGVAELDLKEKDKAEADIAAATAIAPQIAQFAKTQGLSPSP